MDSEATRKSRRVHTAPGDRMPSTKRPVRNAEHGAGGAGSQNRNVRARERTRKKLLDAAYRAMSRVGVEATTINQITEEADLGFGSFYNYFSSKEEIARTVFHVQLADFSDRIDEMNAGIEDASVRLSRNILRILSKARRDPVWGWFFVHAEYALQELRAVFWEAHLRNLNQGLQQGRYRFEPPPKTAGDIAFGATISVMRSILEGRATSTAEAETVELLMTMLGVPVGRAKKLAT